MCPDVAQEDQAMSDAEKEVAEPCVDCGVRHKGPPESWPELEFLRHISAMESPIGFFPPWQPLLERAGWRHVNKDGSVEYRDDLGRPVEPRKARPPAPGG